VVTSRVPDRTDSGKTPNLLCKLLIFNKFFLIRGNGHNPGWSTVQALLAIWRAIWKLIDHCDGYSLIW
jgi:hypothetical protein